MRKFDYINVVPLIDIMLVLLAIVLTTSTFIVTGKIPLSLPEEKIQPSKLKQHQITITITKTGQIFFDEKPVSINRLNSMLNNYNKNTHINIECDKKAYFQFFVSVIKKLQENGFQNLSIIVKIKDE